MKAEWLDLTVAERWAGSKVGEWDNQKAAHWVLTTVLHLDGKQV